MTLNRFPFMGEKNFPRLQSGSQHWKLASAVEVVTSGSCVLCLTGWDSPHCVCQGLGVQLYSGRAELQHSENDVPEILLSGFLSLIAILAYLFGFLELWGLPLHYTAGNSHSSWPHFLLAVLPLPSIPRVLYCFLSKRRWLASLLLSNFLLPCGDGAQ